MDERLKNSLSRVVTRWADWAGNEFADSENGHQTLHKIFVMMGQNLQAQIDGDISKMTMKPDCRAGCHHCCYNQVICTPIEALAIAMHLRATVRDKGQIIASLNEQVEKARDIDAPWQFGRVCPFLRNKRCAIYDFRPLACRALMSPDAKACKAGAKAVKSGKTKDVPFYPLFTHFQSAIQSGVMVASKDMGYFWQPVELTYAVWLAFQQDDPVKKWLTGDNFFDPAKVELGEQFDGLDEIVTTGNDDAPQVEA